MPVVQQFNFDGHAMNMIDIGGEPWVLLKDFWSMLGHPNAHIEKLMALLGMPYCHIACRDGNAVRTETYAKLSLMADFWESAEQRLEMRRGRQA
jgi:prophage antirepressor-like protein